MTEGTDPRAEARIGSVLDEKWTLERLLGSGGMGAVYAARHRNGARAAVKILHPELARKGDVRERFLREGYAANRVEHRGAVSVLDEALVTSGPDEGSAYLVMELLEGESLQARALHPPPLGEVELLRIADAVLDVLAAAHAHGVVHRDLKPENIFLANDPEVGMRVKLLDFGLARLREVSTITTAGIAVGTPSFMSPEQAAGRGDEIDGRTDLFALGATMFRVVTGRRVHEAENMVQLVVLMATMPAPKLRTVFPDASEPFARVVDGALAFAREDRWRDATKMQRAVREAIAELEQPETPPPVPRPRRKKKTTERRRGSTWPWFLLLVLGGIAAWKLVPSLQDFLVEASSRFVPPRARPEIDASPAAAEPVEDAGVDAAPDASDEDEMWPEEEAAPAHVTPHDAGAQKTHPAPPRASVRPHEPPRVAPTKKPPPPPPPPPPRKKKH
jgi:eukaryotic-like serine/threonine-protein kinase